MNWQSGNIRLLVCGHSFSLNGKNTVNADYDRDDTALPLPTLGWVALSRSRLNRAEAQLVEDTTGVRDEIGVLALHTGYANRFFPGTSTQQTRLRYALFVPWQIADLLRQKTSAGHARLALEKREIQLANRLRGHGTGVIGVQNAKLGRPVAIPPSSSYWVALRTWGIVNTMPSGIQPSRNDVFSHWDKWHEGQSRRTVADDEGRALDMFPRLFSGGLPEPQGALRRSGSLNFELSDEERRFLRARLAETTRWFDGKPSLLAALAIAETVPMERDQIWSPRITRHADTADSEAIARARDAASLSAVARALYAAAVETLQNDDGVPSVTTRHRDHLQAVVKEHGARAASLALEEIAEDGVFLSRQLLQVFARIQNWIRHDNSNPLESSMHRELTDWEKQRKKARAKLPRSKMGRDARRVWDDRSTSIPIEYRWPLVRNLLRDLGGSSSGL